MTIYESWFKFLHFIILFIRLLLQFFIFILCTMFCGRPEKEGRCAIHNIRHCKFFHISKMVVFYCWFSFRRRLCPVLFLFWHFILINFIIKKRWTTKCNRDIYLLSLICYLFCFFRLLGLLLGFSVDSFCISKRKGFKEF